MAPRTARQTHCGNILHALDYHVINSDGMSKCSCGNEIPEGYVNAYAVCPKCYPAKSMANLNEAQLLSIKRLRSKGVPLGDIADRIGVEVSTIKLVIKQ